MSGSQLLIGESVVQASFDPTLVKAALPGLTNPDQTDSRTRYDTAKDGCPFV